MTMLSPYDDVTYVYDDVTYVFYHKTVQTTTRPPHGPPARARARTRAPPLRGFIPKAYEICPVVGWVR